VLLGVSVRKLGTREVVVECNICWLRPVFCKTLPHRELSATDPELCHTPRADITLEFRSTATR
jgi:hypothetical protein